MKQFLSVLIGRQPKQDITRCRITRSEYLWTSLVAFLDSLWVRVPAVLAFSYYLLTFAPNV